MIASSPAPSHPLLHACGGERVRGGRILVGARMRAARVRRLALVRACACERERVRTGGFVFVCGVCLCALVRVLRV
jgi:hypothetical protein